MTKKNINLRKKSVIILVWTNKMEKWNKICGCYERKRRKFLVFILRGIECFYVTLCFILLLM